MQAALTFIVVMLGSVAVARADGDAPRREFFEKKIRPMLVAHCYECHSASAAQAGKIKANLVLDTRAGTLAGGETSPAVVPGKPAESLLLQALKHDGLEMPPEGKLSDAVIADFEKWIADGAFDPREGAVAAKNEIDFARARQFWAFRAVENPLPPEVKNAAWPNNDIDRFVLAKLEAAGLEPSTSAPDALLVRRLYFDLIGLPPTPTDVAAFGSQAKENRDAAVAELVDRLLASPHFGERWGRHWLDVVRFAESNGRDQNILWHHAWRYRQYVIDAWNRDLPFNRFVREQVAGDLLPYNTREERDAAITATGMLAMSPKNIEETNKVLFRMDLIDDQIEVTTRAFMGLSVSCARCHDHKFDPITTKDYYALAGIFGSSEPMYGPARWGTRGSPHKHYVAVGADAEALAPAAQTHVQELEQAHLDFTQARVDRYRVVRKVADLEIQLKKPDAHKAKLESEVELLKAEVLVWDEKIKELGKRLEDKIANPPPQPQWVMALRELPQPSDCRVHIRGETTNLGSVVPRGVPQLIEIADISPIGEQESGRLQLAEWLASKHNPLTARVAVNRIWMHLFGRGLVTTLDDFGTTGTPPSHPQLLDYLAARFVAEGWSSKRILRAIVTSRTYQQASDASAMHLERDPHNVLVWRMSPKQLEVEPFRDAILLVAGRLNLEPPSRPYLSRLPPYKNHTWYSHDAFIKPHEIEFPHRTVYLPVVRGVLPEIFTLFDFADPHRVVGQRSESIVPAQALFLMNSPWILDRSQEAAQHLLADSRTDDLQRLNLLFERAFGRSPTNAESERLLDYLSAAPADDSTAQLAAWTRVCQMVFGSAEFRTVR